MATVTSVTKHFSVAKEGFTTTTASSISSGAATVPLNSVTGYTNGDTVALVIEPTATNKQVFTGVIDTAGVQVTGVVWTEGTNVTHNAGATVVDYTTATHWDMLTKGLLRDHNTSGYHKTLNDDSGNEWIEQGSTASAVNQVKIANAATGNAPVISTNGGDSNIGLTLTPKGAGAVKSTLNYDPWVSGLTAPSTVTALGNRSYSVVINSTDYTDRLSPGTSLKLTRTVTAPTQCTSLNGTTQYYSKSSPAAMTFTDDFVVSAWIKVTTMAAGTIASRYNGTSGWSLFMQANGTIQLIGVNGGAGNNSAVTSTQSVPVGRWVHVAAQLDMSTFTATTTTSYVMIDGLDVPATVSRAGTNPTALVQAGNLEIGGQNGGTQPFPGKLAQVAVYNAKVTQATVLASISQTLSGSETSLISAYSFNNTINDLSANANNLTAQGSAAATNADSPFTVNGFGTATGTTDYGIITAAAFSTNTTLTVQVPEGNTIPTSGGVSAISYTTHPTPYGFPAKQKFLVEIYILNATSTSGTTTSTVYNPGGLYINVPVGSWICNYEFGIQLTPNTSVPNFYSMLAPSSSVPVQGSPFNARVLIAQTNNSSAHIFTVNRFGPISVSVMTPYYILLSSLNAFSNLSIRGDVSVPSGGEMSVISCRLDY